MKRILLILVISIAGCSIAFAQGTVRGKITDENGEAVIGGTVVLKSNPAVGTVTDLDGNYSLTITDTTQQVLVISSIGLQPIETTVRLKNGGVLIRDFVLKSSTTEIGEVEVLAKREKAKDYYMENIKQKSATTIDYVSSEVIAKTGDSQVFGAIARVSGVSTNGGFITVRGIGDRYVKTTINSSMIPTLDPFTNNIRLDLFPTSLIDNIVITKTASPDLPGDWAGAYLSVLTKDYPDKLTINIETNVGFNTQSTFKDVITSDRSSTDWLGFDNGFREYQHDNFVNATIDPTTYDEMVALGLGPFYNSMGITSGWQEGSTDGDAYFKLGLAELGLLPKALFNNPVAYNNARQKFLMMEYTGEAFRIINEQAAESGKSFSNNWELYSKKGMPDFTQSFSIGNQVKLFGRPLGFLAGFRYDTNMRYDPESEANRAGVDAQGTPFVPLSADQQASRQSNGWNALLNFSYKYNPSHSISLLFMPNFLGVNNVRKSTETGIGITYPFGYTDEQFYEQRRQLIYQLKSEHYLTGLKTKIELNASYTQGESEAPDFRSLQYFSDEDLQWFIDARESDTHRYFRYLNENLFDSQLSAEVPVGDKPGMVRKLKFGGAFQYRDREYNQFDYVLNYNTAEVTIENNDIEQFFIPEKFDIITDTSEGSAFNTLERYYFEERNPSNRLIGYSKISAGFAMLDFSIIRAMRIAGGLRIEYADLLSDVYEYNKKGYPENDLRRLYPEDLFLVNPGTLQELSFLPSVSLIYRVKQNDYAPANLRFNFSRSVARPSLRELSETIVFDFELNDNVFGNSQLKMVQINNYDLRFENYFRRGDNISVSAFYKDFKDHIELVNSNQGFTWQNVDESQVFGVELEGKVDIVKNLEFRANATYVYSQTKFVRYRLQVTDQVKAYIPLDTISRTMFGQAPYVVNAMLSYSAEKIGLTASVSYNVQGKKLALTSIVQSIPDIYEMPRHLLDFKISKTIDKKQRFSASLKVRNILNAPSTRAYVYDDGSELIYDEYAYGTTFNVGVAYKLN